MAVFSQNMSRMPRKIEEIRGKYQSYLEVLDEPAQNVPGIQMDDS